MARHKLTNTQVKNAGPGKYGDGDGLWLYVQPSGTRSWVYIWQRNGRRREMGLGAFGRGTGEVSLAVAREKATRIREIIGRGGDPFIELEERRKNSKVTFGECADDFIESQRPGWKNEKHAAQWAMTMTDYAKPLRKVPVDEIGVDDVLRCLKAFWLKRPETAARTRGRIEKVLDYASARNVRSGENPARWKGNLDHLLPKHEKLTRGHHAALPYNELPKCWETLSTATGVASAALKFAILTAARSGEVLGATWEEIDLDTGLWTVPAARMKAGREHTVPLGREATEIIRWCLQHKISQFVFPGTKTGQGLSNMAMTAVLRRAKTTGATVHGFRSSFRDWCGNETGFPRELAEEALAHSVGNEVERAYRRGTAIEKRRQLMVAWENFVTASKEAQNVIKLQKNAKSRL